MNSNHIQFINHIKYKLFILNEIQMYNLTAKFNFECQTVEN